MIAFSHIHSANAVGPMLVTVLGMVTLVRLPLPPNAKLPMPTTGKLSMVAGMDKSRAVPSYPVMVTPQEAVV